MEIVYWHKKNKFIILPSSDVLVNGGLEQLQNIATKAYSTQ